MGITLDTTTIYAPSANVTWNDAADEVVLFDQTDGAYYALGSSGTAIWKGMGSGRSIAELADVLAGRFLGERGRIEADIAAFIAQAEAIGLVSAK